MKDHPMDAVVTRTSPRFWNRISKKYARTPIADEAAYQRKLEITQSYMRPDMRVLEFGCGTGSTALIHAPHVAHYDATDFSEGMIEIAKEKAWNASLANLTFRVSSIEDTKPSEPAYDMVLGLSVLHLVRDRAAVLKHASTLIKPGGYLVTSTACLGDMAWWLRAIAPVARALRIFPYVEVFKASTLRIDMVEAGFEIEYDWQPSPDKALFLIARKAL